MGKADLHVHTTFSDGVLTPTEIVERAHEVGLDAVAITDHDSVAGVPEAAEAGRRLGVQVVPGVEINTDVPGSEVHMLGYFLDIESPALKEALHGLREGRLRRAERMVLLLRRIGVPVRLERVLEIAGGGAAVGRPHVAQAIIELGRASDMNDAFGKYLGRGRPAHAARRKFTPEQAIGIIRAAGGVPVLAHPALSGCDRKVRGWVRAGMRGIEADHSEHQDAQVCAYRRLARDLGLIATAGSDFHGLPGNRTVLGGHTCDTEVVERLRQEAERIRAGQ